MYIINSARNCISSKRSFVYHQADRYTHLRCDDIRRTKCGDDMQPCRADDMPSLSAWIKKFQVRRLGIFWRYYPNLNHRILFAFIHHIKGQRNTPAVISDCLIFHPEIIRLVNFTLSVEAERRYSVFAVIKLVDSTCAVIPFV